MRLQAALDGLGLALLFEDQVAQQVQDGGLLRVLADWCPPFPGYHLYYTSRRQPTHAFALFVDALRLHRQAAPAARASQSLAHDDAEPPP